MHSSLSVFFRQLERRNELCEMSTAINLEEHVVFGCSENAYWGRFVVANAFHSKCLLH